MATTSINNTDEYIIEFTEEQINDMYHPSMFGYKRTNFNNDTTVLSQFLNYTEEQINDMCPNDVLELQRNVEPLNNQQALDAIKNGISFFKSTYWHSDDIVFECLVKKAYGFLLNAQELLKA